jgi:hypothetical protein
MAVQTKKRPFWRAARCGANSHSFSRHNVGSHVGCQHRRAGDCANRVQCSKEEKEKEEGDLKLRRGLRDKATEGTVIVDGIKT